MTESEQQSILHDWLKQYQALLFKVVRAYAFQADDQEDLFQEILIQVWRSIPNFQQKSSVTTWLYRVALNTALRWNRQGNKHQEGRQGLEEVEHLLQENPAPRDERLDWLYQEIGKLDKIDRSLSLLLLDGFSYKEMAAILGISESHIGVKIHRIKKHLIAQSDKYHRHGV